MDETVSNPTESHLVESAAPHALILSQHGQAPRTSPAPHADPTRNGQARGLPPEKGRRRRPRRRAAALNTAINKPASMAIPQASRWPMGREIAILRRQLEASGAVQPSLEKKSAVLVLAPGSKKQHACEALFTQRHNRSLVTASAVKSYGFVPSEMPPGESRQPFSSPLGRICPRRFVTLVVEQMRIGLPSTPEKFIVLDENVSSRGFDLFLGTTFLQHAFGGALPSEISVVPANPVTGQMTVPHQYVPSNGPENGFMDPAVPPQPLTSADYSATQPSWGSTGQAAWNQQGANALDPFSFVGATSYHDPALSVSHGPIAGEGPSFLPLLPDIDQQTSPGFPGLQTPWYPNGAQTTSPSIQWPPQQSDDFGLGDADGNWQT